MTNFEKVKQFMSTFGQEVKDRAEFPHDKIVDLRIKLIEEELQELKDAPVPVVFASFTSCLA